MIRIAALNQELSEESCDADETIRTKEAEETDALNSYKEALALRQKNDLNGSLKLFNHILALPSIENAQLDANQKLSEKNDAPLPPCLQIKYASLKNIGALQHLLGSPIDAIDAYLEAVEVDAFDVTVWYSIGKLSVQLKDLHLARHAFEQGLLCSPTHWPCLDSLISVLYGTGDDLACLHYICQALKRDLYYTKGLILKNTIFQQVPTILEDIKKLEIEDWPLLLENGEYEESEKRQVIDQTTAYSELITGGFRESVLPTVHLEAQSVPSGFASLGQSLIAGFTRISEDKILNFNCPIEFDTVQPTIDDELNTLVPASVNNECTDAMEEDPCIEGKGSEQKLGDLTAEPETNANRGNEDKPNASGTELQSAESSVSKLESNKRKRSVDNLTSTQEQNHQRRSTRSNACAQRVEEDIDSLRAELRSFLPTSLLLEDAESSVNKEKEFEPEKKKICSGLNAQLPSITETDEQKLIQQLMLDIQSSQQGIVDTLYQFCSVLTKLDSYHWPDELIHIYKEVYQLFRTHRQLPNVFDEHIDVRQDGICVLIHAEIFISLLKRDPQLVVPPWFLEDLTFLSHLADRYELDNEDCQSLLTRVYWLHCHWHYHHCRVEMALNYLEKVEQCLSTMGQESVSTEPHGVAINTKTIEEISSVTSSQIDQLQQVLLRTIQLEDVEELYKTQQFTKLVDVLKATISESNISSQYRITVNRPTLIRMLLEGLIFLETVDEYIIWAEQFLDEGATIYLSSLNEKSEGIVIDHLNLWSKLVKDILTQINDILSHKRASLGVLKRKHLSRFAENLVLICSQQLETSELKAFLDSTVPWILLHRTIEFEEKRQIAVKESKMEAQVEEGQDVKATVEEEAEDEGLSCSVLFLLSAHDLLGKRSWCMSQEAKFAIYTFEVLVRKRKTTEDVEHREELGRAIEQASYCALGYPTSRKTKTRLLMDHNCSNVPMTWNYALLLAEFFLPEPSELPEFDTLTACNAEQEVLLLKIVNLIPSELDPKHRLDDIQDFIDGKKATIPDYLKHNGLPSEVANVFYLLGDYYFKNKDWAKAIEHYLLDLTMVPSRFDSWAALALATASRLETKLNSCENLKNVAAFLDRAEAALRCFRRALRLRPSATTLWIEHGSTAYMLHSHCSQLLHNQTDSLSIELFERLEKEKDRMLDIAHDCFKAADKAWLSEADKNSGLDQDERWLHHYMLGKVAEKRGQPIGEFIAHYHQAAVLLEEASAAYPPKISYNSPPHLSVEALEIYYRIHSNILKTLLASQDRPLDPSLALILAKYLKLAANGLFCRGGKKNSVDNVDDTKETAQDKEKGKSKSAKPDPNKAEAVNPLTKPEPTESEPAKLDIERPDKEKAPTKSSPDHGKMVKQESRGATIIDVTAILGEIIEKVVLTAKQPIEVVAIVPETGTTQIPNQTIDSTPVSDSETAPNPTSSSTSTSTSTSTSSSSPSSESEVDNDVEMAEVVPLPDTQSMVDMCLMAIKECVSRFPHFYKGLYRLAHYYYHSKTHHNIEACRELLFGRPLSASITQLQQQQGNVQPRFLPVGVAGLFAEWRSNNFFHGIWRIPINEIDRPGCFAAHMGRSTALLLEVLHESRDHRLLMELALALKPEPEADKKYLFDSEREQHASVALSLMGKVLRIRLQAIKEALEPVPTPKEGESILPTIPQQTSPSSSKMLSLLMDIFRAHDRMERNLPGQESNFSTILVESYKLYKGVKESSSENAAEIMEQALVFCRTKQAQSRVRVGGMRGTGAGNSSLGTLSNRGKRGTSLNTSRRGRQPTTARPHYSSLKTAPSSAPGGTDLPPGLSNLLAQFSHSMVDTLSLATASSSKVLAKDNPATAAATAPISGASSASATNVLTESAMRAAIPNPYAYPGLMTGGTSTNDAQALQLQFMNWMQQAALAQSFLLSGMNPASIASIPKTARGGRMRGSGKATLPTKRPSKPSVPSVPSSILPSTPSSSKASDSSRPDVSKISQTPKIKAPQLIDSAAKKPMVAGFHLPPGISMSTKDTTSKNNPLNLSDLTANFGSVKGKTIRKSNDQRPSKPSQVFPGLPGLPGSLSIDNPLSKFPLNFGRDITVTASTKPKASAAAESATSSHVNKSSNNFPTGSSSLLSSLNMLSSMKHVPNMAKGLPLDLHKSVGSQNLGFSVLQNLPSSMSLLVKQSKLGGAKTNLGTQGAVDMSMNKTSSMPKLTPAPGLAKKDKTLPTLQASVVPPPLRPGMHSSALSAGISSGISTKLSQPPAISKPVPKVTKSKNDRDSEDSDVVVLD